ncbi:MAG: cytochrome c [Ferruginibacter sp.]|nr:cytochrome c [Cytophagales bacterium]
MITKTSFRVVATLSVLACSLYSFRATSPTPQQDPALAKSVKAGQTVYSTYCAMCHQPTGLGIAGVYPPLAKSDYLMADSKRVAGHIKNGLQGEIVVNGKKYNQVMPAQPLTDQQITDVLNYVRNSWGNKGKAVTLAEVKSVKKKAS